MKHGKELNSDDESDETPGINYVEFIENSGFTLDATIGSQVDAATPDELSDFRDRYLALAETFISQTRAPHEQRANLALVSNTNRGRIFDCPESKRGEFRPMLHGRIMATGDTMLGGNGGSDFNELNLEVRLRRIKGLLLYSHSLVVPDSLFYINQFLDRRTINDRTDYYLSRFEVSRRQLRNYLSLIAELKPLITSKTIIFYPQFEHGQLGFGEHLDFEDKEFESWLECTAASRSSNERFEAVAAYGDVSELLFLASRYDATAITDTRFDSAIRCMTAFAKVPVRKDKERHSQMVLGLANVDLPEMSNISLSDVIAIRRDEEVFARWRTLLSAAIEKIENFGELPPDIGIAEIQDILREGEALIADGMAKVSVWKLVGESVDRFLLSTLAGFVAKGTPEATPAAFGLLSFLEMYIRGSKRRRAQLALRNHFASFTGLGPQR